MAQAFKETGYNTYFVCKWHLGSEAYYPNIHGVDVNIGGCCRGMPRTYFSPYNIENLDNGLEGECLTDETLRLMGEIRGEPYCDGLSLLPLLTVEGTLDRDARFIAIPHHTNAISYAIKDDGSHYWDPYPWKAPRNNCLRLLELLQTRGNFERENPSDG